MKNILFVIFAFTFILACAPKSPSNISESAPVNQCMIGAPTWVLGAVEGGLSSTGTAKIGNAGLGFAKTEALANARDELARTLSVKVNNMFKNFTQTTGIGDAETVDKVSANISRQVASQMISGSRQIDGWVSPCNDLHVLLVIDAEQTKEVIQQQVQTSLKNEQALWQQFQAKKGFEELDKYMEEEFKSKQ